MLKTNEEKFKDTNEILRSSFSLPYNTIEPFIFGESENEVIILSYYIQCNHCTILHADLTFPAICSACVLYFTKFIFNFTL